MEEPQHRPSPIAKTCHSTSESYELERTSSKIQHTREHVESLKQRIDYELDKLKKFRDYFVKVGDSERSVKKPVSKVVQRKHTTWRENLEANRTRRNRLGGIPGEIKRVVAVKSSPESGNSKESPHKKGPTPPEKYTPKPTPKDKESGEKRPTGGWCWCCGQCSYPCSVYQGSYGSPCNGACDCDCITNGCCNWNPDQQYPLQDCREVSPHQECRFGIPYRVFPRQTANRKVSDLNTEEYLRNAKDCAAMMPDRAKKPIKKCQRSPSTGSKRTESSGRAKSPIGVAMLKLDKKCTKIQEKKLEKLCEKPVKKEQRTIKKEVKREQRTLEKPVKKEPKCTWENDRKIKDENYENYIRMYEQENCRDIPPECADNKGPSPCNIKGRTYPQVEKCPFENQPSSLMDSDKIREKIRKLIDLKNFRGHQRAEEKPNSCETYNEPRNLPDLGRENSEIQICLPYWCTDHIPCNAQQENSCESFDEALNRKCLEEMAREKGNPKMEYKDFPSNIELKQELQEVLVPTEVFQALRSLIELCDKNL
nr:uncharacterized protein LOC108132550 [Drosophila bipectinata]